MQASVFGKAVQAQGAGGGKEGGQQGGAKLGSHGARPTAVQTPGCSFGPQVAGAGCRAEWGSQRPICLLKQPPPARLQRGAVVTAPAQGGRAPCLEAPALSLCLSTSCSGLPSLLLRTERQVVSLGGLEQGPLRPGAVPGQMWLAGWRRNNMGTSWGHCCPGQD